LIIVNMRWVAGATAACHQGKNPWKDTDGFTKPV
jgi:hypothetical protein